MRNDTGYAAGRRTSAILIASDRAAQGIRPDETAPRLRAELEAIGFTVCHAVTVPDERSAITGALVAWVDDGIELIVVSGGTGVAPTDVTPEATLDVIERRVPGMEEAMRRASCETTPFAMLSRGVVGVARGCLIVNLPGNPTGAVENLRTIAPALEHAIELIRGGTPDR